MPPAASGARSAGVVVDGYAQAGMVGARRRDLFADGALRGGYRRELGGSRSLTLGGGAWGAAQPGVSNGSMSARASRSACRRRQQRDGRGRMAGARRGRCRAPAPASPSRSPPISERRPPLHDEAREMR